MLHFDATTSLKALKKFAADNNIEVTGHKGRKQSYIDAINAWQEQQQEVVTEATELETVSETDEPVEVTTEPVESVKLHNNELFDMKDASSRTHSDQSIKSKGTPKTRKLKRKGSIFSREMKRLFT